MLAKPVEDFSSTPAGIFSMDAHDSVSNALFFNGAIPTYPNIEVLSYADVGSDMNLSRLNNLIKHERNVFGRDVIIPNLNSNDKYCISNHGTTIMYRLVVDTHKIYYDILLVNVDHPNNIELKSHLRDLKINDIIW